MDNTNTVSFSLTVRQLADVLYGDVTGYTGAEDLNVGTYDGDLVTPGTIPLRPVPMDARLLVEDRGRGNGIKVTDFDGGWIADRVCDGTLGRRQWKKLCNAYK